MRWYQRGTMLSCLESATTVREVVVAEAVFRWKYSGSALDGGAMDVRDLAPALLAVGDSCARANRLVNGNACHVQVKVNAGFERGSFEILLTLVSTPQAQMIIERIADANELLRFLGYGGGVAGVVVGAVRLHKFLRGRRPDRVTAVDADRISIQVGDNSIVVLRPVYNITRDPQMQEHLRTAIGPLTKEGIDSLSIGPDHSDAEVITKADLECFAQPIEEWTDETKVYVNHVHGPYEIASVPFEAGLVWRLRHPDEESGRFTARMADEEFLARVNAGQQSFTKGDVLVIDLLVEAHIDQGGPKTEYTIERVHKHITPRRSGLPELPLPPEENAP